MKSLVDYIRNTVQKHEGDKPVDGQLLTRFLDHREEAAFTALVERHGPMVLGVARRLLAHAQDAEDVFQATFLILVKKGDAIGRRDLLANWLYGVACRTALEARRLRARRCNRETPMDKLPDTAAPQTGHNPDLRELVDEELSSLRDKYRTAIVLCELEGRSRKDAAQQLGIPEGTLSSRLAMARRLLAERLARRGFVMSTGAVAAALGPMAQAEVPTMLVTATSRSAVSLLSHGAAAADVSSNILALVHGVIQAMFLKKLKAVTLMLLALGLVALTTAGIVQGTMWSGAGLAADPPLDRQDKPTPPGVPGAKETNQDKKETNDKQPLPDTIRPGDRLEIQVRDTLPDNPIHGVFVVEPSGKVALGPLYGRLKIQDMTLEEAEDWIRQHLARILRKPAVGVTRYDALAHSGLGAQIEKLEKRVRQLETEQSALRKVLERIQK